MAKRFRFRLESVLRVRLAERDAQQRLVAECVRALQEQHRERDALSAELRAQFHASRDVRGSVAIDLNAVRAHQVYVGRLQRRILDAGVQIGACDRELERQRLLLAEAATKVKALEKLKERQRQAHLLAQSRAEQQVTDEVGAQMYIGAARERVLSEPLRG